MLRLSLAIGMGLLCGPQDDTKEAIEDFKARIKDEVVYDHGLGALHGRPRRGRPERRRARATGS